VADLRFVVAQINRYDRARQVSVEANLQGIAFGMLPKQLTNYLL